MQSYNLTFTWFLNSKILHYLVQFCIAFLLNVRSRVDQVNLLLVRSTPTFYFRHYIMSRRGLLIIGVQCITLTLIGLISSMLASAFKVGLQIVLCITSYLAIHFARILYCVRVCVCTHTCSCHASTLNVETDSMWNKIKHPTLVDKLLGECFFILSITVWEQSQVKGITFTWESK